MRVTPRPAAGIVAFLLYLAAFYGVWAVRGVDYPRIGANADTLFNWYALPLMTGAAVLAVVTTVYGWWRPALGQEPRAPRWVLFAPALMALLALVVLVGKDTSGTTGTMLLWLVVGSLGVGFSEEMATRGLLLVGLRSAMNERRAWFVSTLLFGLLHLPNWIFGSGPAALVQVGTTFLLGTTLYLARRGSGSLVTAMAVHALWDFANFIGSGSALLPSLGLVLGAVSVGVALWITRKPRAARAGVSDATAH